MIDRIIEIIFATPFILIGLSIIYDIANRIIDVLAQ